MTLDPIPSHCLVSWFCWFNQSPVTSHCPVHAMPVQWKLKWKSAFRRLTAEQFSGTNIHNILCFSAYATNRFLVHPSIHHKTNEHRSSQKNTYSFQPRILTDKFIIKKHHCVQIWNFLLVVHLQKLMIHRYSLNSTEPPWLRNTTTLLVSIPSSLSMNN